MAQAIPVAGFMLDTVVGSGGHGLVWRARHQKTGLPVAVKVLPPAADRYALHGLKNEVQATARLHHPHVISILDTGILDQTAATESKERERPLEQGSPWLAIELASGGDLSQVLPPLSWGTTYDVLRTLFSALAHAHARGVVHRDLKPANILLCSHFDVRPGLKLTDFGLATWEKGDRLAGGTPLFMAPEQFDADTRDVGPWTDLYALGCVARYLLSGEPPFTGDTWRKLEKMHRSQRPAPLPKDVDVPDGFEEFLERLLEKDPAQRFRCAADADEALASLDRARPAPPQDRLPDGLDRFVREKTAHKSELASARTLMKDPSSRANGPPGSDFGEKTEKLPERDHHPLAPRIANPNNPNKRRAVQRLPSETSKSGGTTSPPPDVGAVAPPSTWRPPAQAPLADLRFIDAGLSLWGMRPVPLIGRAEERDLLWGALLDVHTARRPRFVALRGPSGVGKSRLAEWMSHRAHEVGAALPLKATFAQSSSRGDGLAGMIARHIGLFAQATEADRGERADQVDADERARAWLTRWLPYAELVPVELLGLCGVLDGVFPSIDERYSALLRLLTTLSRERPLLIWLDDVHWGADALTLVERVLDDAPELRALFICTAVDEMLSEDANAKLASLCAHRAGHAIDLRALDEHAHDELCRVLLAGSASDLVEELRRRTEGNPMFAVHVVGEWIARGVLEVSPDGLRLKDGASGDLPDALFSLWEERLSRALAGEDADALRAIEIASVLGSHVDFVEWEAACSEAGLGRASLDRVVDALVSAGLVRRTENGVGFVHVLVRSGLERRATKEGRIAAHHAAAASALALLWGTDTPTAAARIGRHALAAGRHEDAAGLLLRAARAAIDEGEVLEAAAILSDWERARRALGVTDVDPRVAAGLVLKATVANREGRHDEVATLTTVALKALSSSAATGAADARLRTEAACIAGRSAIAGARLDDARASFEAAMKEAKRAGDRASLGLALLGLGEADYYAGDRVACAQHYREAERLFRETGKKHDMAQLLWALGYVELEEGRLVAAARMFEEQRVVCRAIRDRLGEANAENALGELARKTGDLKEAEHRYKVAIRIATKSGLSRRWLYRLNLAHTKVAAGEVGAAAHVAAELLDSPLARNEPLIASSCWWIVAHDAALRGDLLAYDKAADAAIAAGDNPFVEEDLAVVAQQAGDAVAKRDAARALRAWEFARAKWRALGRPEEQDA